MIEKILQEFREKYLNKASNLSELAKALKRAHLGFSDATLDTLITLEAEQNAPIKIGVIGQFSSGKSTLLNLFLPQEILATGARPVSMFAARICYGDFAVYSRKAQQLRPVAGVQNDQNEPHSNSADELIIFSPDERLNGIEFIDTPGLNANAADEAQTLALLENFDAILWLSSALAASKASEMATLKQLKCPTRWCLLTQSDLLDEPAQQKALEHAKEFFGDEFDGISLFSAKKAKNGDKNSGMDKLQEFLRSLNRSHKEQKIRRILRQIAASSQEASAQIISDLAELNATSARLCEEVNLLANSKDISQTSAAVLGIILDTAKQIAALLNGSLKEHTGYIYESAKGLFSKGKFIQRQYRYQSLRPSQIAADIFYNDDKFRRHLNSLKSQILQSFSALESSLDARLQDFCERLEREQTRVLGSAKCRWHNEFFYKYSHQFYEALNEQVECEFYAKAQNAKAQIRLLCEQINIKALGNFERACTLCAAFFYEKINSAREFYEANSAEFKLYSPSFEEIFKRLCEELCFYEFDELLENRRALFRVFENFASECERAHRALEDKISTSQEAARQRAQEINELFSAFI